MKLNVKLDKEGYVIVNGQEMPVENFYKNIYNPIKKKNMKFFLVPEPFRNHMILRLHLINTLTR